MKYIVHNRFKGLAICGEVNIPSNTECEKIEGMIILNGKPLCVATSENAHRYFSRNDDGNGMERGFLTSRIISTLKKQDDLYQTRWDAVWDDTICRKYKMRQHQDNWVWNHSFFNAPIEDLRYIYKLVSDIHDAKGG